MVIEISREPTAFQDFEHDGWEAVSDGYERHFARLTGQTVEPLLDAAGVAGGMGVLDVCTGPGLLAGAAVKRGAQAVGVDFSGNAVEIARRNVPGAEFLEGDAQALPFDSESFDAVVCGYGIIHVPDPEKALTEMRRVLRPGGKLAASVWQAPQPDNGFGVLYGAIRRHGDVTVPLPHGPDFFQFSDAGKLADAFQASDFADVEIRLVEQSWEFSEPLGLVTALLEGGVRARALLRAQTEDARKAIATGVEEGMRQFRSSDDAYRVPMPALVGSGRR